MLFKYDLHTHSRHSDGEATIFEMGREAFEKGLLVFGCSDHAYTEHPDGTHGFGIRGDALDAYINDVYTLQNMYLGKMDVLCGLEMENIEGFRHIDEFQDSQLNYLIGSTHTVSKNGVYYEVDHSEERFREACETLYDGDYYALVRDYYELEARVVENTRCDIIGHFDLVTKFNEGNKYFDESSPKYLMYALSCLEKLVKADIPFEINPGAIARGHRTAPYPSRILLEELRALGGRVILDSDAHDPLFIAYHFEEDLQLIRDCGFTKVSVIGVRGEAELDI